MVVVYHLYPGSLRGGFVGVDVFFVISGFLITAHLARGWQRSGRVHLLEFWGRRARRLLPAAALVLTVTWLVSRVALPATRLPAAADQVRGSALYFQNWILARDAVDYLTASDSPSPVQHFWSLSVEEQFYLFWPFVFVVAGLIGWRLRRTGRIAAVGIAAATVLGSLAYSAHLTGTDPAAAYFVTTTRIWELGAGGVLALVSPRLRDRLAGQSWLAWVGLGLIASAAVTLSGSSAFPGTVALVPVLGAVLLIACGSDAARSGPWRLTSNRPMVFVGDISYSLYLWHWPVIVLWQSYSGGRIGLLDGPVLVAASVLLAWLTKVFVEDRIRLAPYFAKHTGHSLALVLTVLVPVGIVAAYSAPSRYVGRIDPVHAGAGALAPVGASPTSVAPAPQVAAAPFARTAKVIPPIAQAPQDFDPYTQCEAPTHSVKPRPCFYGNRRNAVLTIALVGDSVANQYRSILADAARKRHWYVITDLHSQCPWTATMTAEPGTGNAFTACQKWGRTVEQDMLNNYHPDILVSSDRPVIGTPSHHHADATSFGAIAAGMVTYWKALAAHGTKIVGVQESPEPGRNIPDCLSRPGATAASCTTPTAKAVLRNTPIEQAVEQMGAEAERIDLNSLICSPTQCPPIVGNVVVYRDTHHLTQTYITSLGPFFMEQLLATRAVADR